MHLRLLRKSNTLKSLSQNIVFNLNRVFVRPQLFDRSASCHGLFIVLNQLLVSRTSLELSCLPYFSPLQKVALDLLIQLTKFRQYLLVSCYCACIYLLVIWNILTGKSVGNWRIKFYWWNQPSQKISGNFESTC